MPKSLSFSFLILVAVCSVCAGYDPPEDKAGPLEARIENPSEGGGNLELTSAEQKVPVVVTLRNTGSRALRGTVRLELIDGWSAAPKVPVAFETGPRATTQVRFAVAAAASSYNAQYPVHAFVEFELDGKQLTAHPVLILDTRYSHTPRVWSPVDWKPMPLMPNSGIAMLGLATHRETATVVTTNHTRGSGSELHETTSPVAYTTIGRGGIRMQLGPQPGGGDVVESGAMEFPFRLPKQGPIRLAYSIMASAQTTFRVRVGSFDDKTGERRTVFEQSRARDFTEHRIDLTEYAGRDIVVSFEARSQFESEVYYIDPAIYAGVTQMPAGFPPDDYAENRELGEAGGYKATIWPGRRGIFDTAIGFVKANQKLLFRGFHIKVLGDSLEDVRCPTQLLSVADESSGNRSRLRHRFESRAGAFDLMSDVWVEAGALRVHLWLENVPQARPWLAVRIEEASHGSWTENIELVYAGAGNVVARPRPFRLEFGSQLSTSFVGYTFENRVSLVEGVDVPPTRLEVDSENKGAGLIVAGAQTLTFIPAANVWEGVKRWREINGVHAAPGVEKLAGRFVFDSWEKTSYRESKQALERAFRYGLTDALVVWHDWQRWGYDYRLPDMFPPNPKRGPVEDFAALVRTCREHGVLFAPQDNYAGAYPDSEGFSYSNIAFEEDGSPQPAWFNFARQAHSYRFRPDRIAPFVERNLKLVKTGFAPDAYLVAGWASQAPYDYWTSDGKFVSGTETRDVWAKTLSWIRGFLGGNAPQISEAGGDQLAGSFDGAQAQVIRASDKGEPFTWAVAYADTERVPWFDAAHHDRMALHGAGYAERYAGGLDLQAHGIYSDDYISTEVLTGHPGMVSDLFSRDVVRKYWLLHDLMRGLALQTIETVAFKENSLHCQEVQWRNGATIRVNRRATDWEIDGHVLPAYGFYASIPAKDGTVEAAIERREGNPVEWARSSSAVYVNGRGKPVSIAGISTAAAVRVAREGKAIVITPLPETGQASITVKLSELPWKMERPRRVVALAEDGTAQHSRRVPKKGDELKLVLDPGVFGYRLEAGR